MKIYLFNPESGVYQGEDFTDDLPLCPGRSALLPHATTIAPSSYLRGEVPVFLEAKQQWEIQTVSAVKSRSSG